MKKILSAIYVVLCLIALAVTAFASTAQRLSEGDILNQADRIVKAILNAPGTSAWDSEHRRIYTTFSFEVEEDLAGTGDKHFDLVQPGGEVEDVGQRVDGFPSFHPGDRVVLFLRSTERGYQIVGLTQGVFESHNDGGVEKFIQRPEGLHLIGGNQTPLQIDRAHLEQQIKTLWAKRKSR